MLAVVKNSGIGNDDAFAVKDVAAAGNILANFTLAGFADRPVDGITLKQKRSENRSKVDDLGKRGFFPLSSPLIKPYFHSCNFGRRTNRLYRFIYLFFGQH